MAEPVRFLVALQLADEFSAAGSQAATTASMSSMPNARWRIPGVCRLSPWYGGEWNFTSSSRPSRSEPTPNRRPPAPAIRNQRELSGVDASACAPLKEYKAQGQQRSGDGGQEFRGRTASSWIRIQLAVAAQTRLRAGFRLDGS